MKRMDLRKRWIATIRITTTALLCSALVHVVAFGLAAAVADARLGHAAVTKASVAAQGC